ncbi:hypothetical protein JTE90_010313 [Oedothorax gibbosus]|uniref:Uncharacterized protein n=1 Tax=Oedothorax gibbosus TaxID=931172 RepID=A0AAV6V4Q3_9ARAC|nr:hypothetical protein JTE90_010313 [Oedothorax gibbosus]
MYNGLTLHSNIHINKTFTFHKIFSNNSFKARLGIVDQLFLRSSHRSPKSNFSVSEWMSLCEGNPNLKGVSSLRTTCQMDLCHFHMIWIW